MVKILYVEDNPQNMRLVRKMLKGNNYDLIEAPDGCSALQVAMREMPDLILMDINLPDIDGLEVTNRLRAEPDFPEVPIIALTANAMIGDKERFLNGGCDGYIAKPVSRRELLSTIEQYLGVEV